MVESLVCGLCGASEDQICNCRAKKGNAHVCIQIEKCSIDARQIVRRDDAVFPSEHGNDREPANPVYRSHFRTNAHHREKSDGAKVAKRRNLQ